MEIVTRQCALGYSFSCDDDPSLNTSTLKLHTYDYNNCTCDDTDSRHCDVRTLETIDSTCSIPDNRIPFDMKMFPLPEERKALTGYYTLTCDFSRISKRIVVLISTLVILPSAALTVDDFGDYTYNCNNYCEAIASSLSIFFRTISNSPFPSTNDVFIISVTRSSVLVNVRDDDPFASTMNDTVFKIQYQLSSVNPVVYERDQLSAARSCADLNLNCASSLTMEEVVKQRAKNLSAFHLYDTTVWTNQRVTNVIRRKKISFQVWFIATVVLCTSLFVTLFILSIWFVRRKLKRSSALANMKNYTESAKMMKQGSQMGEVAGESKEMPVDFSK